MIIRHRKQIAMMNDPSRFKFILAGRRGGKTKGMAELMVEDIHTCPPRGTVFYIGPTNQQAMELIWEELDERLYQTNWSYKPLVSKQRFEFSRRRRLMVIGAEKLSRIRGHKAWSVNGDELAFWKADLNKAWRAIRPTLTDFRGKCRFGTTPDGKGTQTYKFYLDLMKSKKDRKTGLEIPSEWKYFYWKTLDNPFLDPDEIEEARNTMDEKSFRQEYEAEWESFEGLAYYCFDEKKHIATESIKKIDESKPLGLVFDFNVNPTTILLAQDVGDSIVWRGEYSQKNSSTLDTLKTFCDEHRHLKDKIKLDIHGDSTGKNRKSNTGYSDYHYVQELLTERGFKFEYKVPAVNPSIVDRVAHSNGFLKNVKGDSRTLIDPSCVELINDLGTQPLEGREPSSKGNIGHKADAFGYRIWWQILMGRKQETTWGELM